MSLSEALAKGLVDSQTGKVTDRYSGKSVKLSDAIKRGLINPNTLEIFPPVDSKPGKAGPSQKLSLKEALEKNIVNETTGNYADSMSLQEASQKKLISAPMTIKECDDSELLIDKGIKCPATGVTMTLLDAIGSGVIDVDLKSVKDVKEGVLVSLSQALAKDIIISEFGQDTPGPVQFKDTQTNEVMTLPEAVKRGHLTTVTKKSIFDIEGIKDSNTGDYVSFNQAKKLGIIDQVTGKFNEHKTNRKISFIEASSKDLLQPQLLEMLKKPIGIYSADKKRELSLLEAVNEGLVDTHSGLLIDTSTNKTLPMDKALELQLISPMGVAVLKSLLNITVTSATVTQTVKRYIQFVK
jgi:dystonin